MNKERYKIYDARVYEYMCILIEQLEKEYGKFQPEWIISLDILAQTYSAYLIGWDAVQSDGMYVKDDKNRLQRNPALTVMLNSQAYIQKLIHSFGLNPMAKSKLKAPETTDGDDYLDSI